MARHCMASTSRRTAMLFACPPEVDDALVNSKLACGHSKPGGQLSKLLQPQREDLQTAHVQAFSGFLPRADEPVCGVALALPGPSKSGSVREARCNAVTSAWRDRIPIPLRLRRRRRRSYGRDGSSPNPPETRWSVVGRCDEALRCHGGRSGNAHSGHGAHSCRRRGRECCRHSASNIAKAKGLAYRRTLWDPNLYVLQPESLRSEHIPWTRPGRHHYVGLGRQELR